MSHHPCHHDCTDFPDLTDEAEDKGCCVPAPFRRTCEAPILPVPQCDEENPEIIYDEDTEEFFAVGILYDSECSPITDQSFSTLTALVA